MENADLQESAVGFIEPFVLSNNRRELLTKLVEDSEERVYFTLLQLEREIENELKEEKINDNDNHTIHQDDVNNNNDANNEQNVDENNDQNANQIQNEKLNILIKDMDDLISGINNNDALKNVARIRKVVFRHQIRLITMNKNRSDIGWNALKNVLWLYPKYKKPIKQRLGQSSDEKQFESIITDKDIGIDNSLFLLKEKLDTCVKYKKSLNQHFEYNAIDFIVSDENIECLTPYLITQILNWSSSIFIEEKKLFKLILKDFKLNKKVEFGSRFIHKKLTLEQLDKLIELNEFAINEKFLLIYLEKLVPKLMMKYDINSSWKSNAPIEYKLQFYDIIKEFIKSHLTNSKHSNIKCILLYFLMNEQYEYNGTFDINLFIEFLKIPKRRNYNKRIFKYYDCYNERYLEQQEVKKQKREQQMIAQADNTIIDEGDKDKNNENTIDENEQDDDDDIKDDDYDDLAEMKMIGDEVDWVTDYYASQYALGSFGNIRNDEYLIKLALKYFFENNSLLNELCLEVSDDIEKFNKLSKHYKQWLLEKKVLNIERMVAQQLITELMDKEDQKMSTDGVVVSQSGTDGGGGNTDDVPGGEDDYEIDEDDETDFVVESESYLLVKLLLPYIDKNVLQVEQAEYELLSGNISTQSRAHRNLIKLKGLTYTEELKNKVMVEFEKNNKRKYNMSDECKLYIKVKNVKKLLLKVFKIKTTPYFKKNKQQVASNLNLEGLESSVNKEILINVCSSEFEMKHIEIVLPSLMNKRGLFFVDFIGNGLHARCIIKKGDMKYIELKNNNGHILKLIDENHNILLRTSVWIDNKQYLSNNKTGDIFIPYAKQNASTNKMILQNNDWNDFSVLADLSRLSQNFNLFTTFYVERESLLEKMESFVLISNALYVNNCKVSVEKLKDVELSLKITTLDGVQVNKQYKNIKLCDDKDYFASFSLPNNPSKLQFIFRCKVKLMNGSYQNFEKNKVIQINKIDKTNDIAIPHLIPHLTGIPNFYIIAVLGKNGEPIAGVHSKLHFKYHRLKNQISVDSQSNKDGIIYLPNLTGVTNLNINCAGHISSFSFPMNKCLSPFSVHIEENKSFYIPYFNKSNTINENINCKLYDKLYSKEYVNLIEYKNGLFVCSNGLDAGSYVLCCDYNQYQCRIYVTQQTNGTNINNLCIENETETFIELNNNNYKPLQILDIKDDEIKINMNENNLNRVHLFLSHRYPSFPIFNTLKTLPYSTKEIYDYKSPLSMYCKSRSISEEYRYVLERVTANKFVGNLLKRPSLLLKPWSLQSTKTKIQEAARADNIERKIYDKNRRIIESKYFKYHHVDGLMPETGSFPNLEFLSKYPSKMVFNLIPNKNGIVKIPKDIINPNHNFMTVVAINNQQEWSIKTKSLSKNIKKKKTENKTDNIYLDDEDESEYDKTKISDYYSDARLMNGLNPNKHFTEQREIILLNTNDIFKVENFKNCEMEIFVSLRDIFNLFYTLSNNNKLNEFTFLFDWNKLNKNKQINKLNKYMSNEMNIYLYFKHREYFDRIIKPFLHNKIEKTLVDYFLIGDIENLFKYTNQNFNSLNAAEKIFLGLAFKHNVKYKHITKQIFSYFKEKNESLKIKPSKFKQLFNKALTQRFDNRNKQKINVSIPSSLPIFTEEKVSTDYLSQVPYRTQQCLRNKQDKLSKKKRLYLKDYDEDIMRRFDDDNDDDDDDYNENRLQEIDSNLFDDLSECKEYQEANYYKTSNLSQTNHLIPTNKFWCDVGEHLLFDNDDIKRDENEFMKKPFLSKYVFLATSSFTEMIIALSILDLPIDGNKPNMNKNFDTFNMEISCPTPCIIFCKQLTETEVSQKRSITVSQHYFDPDDKYTKDIDDEKMDKFIECDKFETTKIYGCRCILSNASSSSLNVEVLYQIPTGSIPVKNGKSSKTEFIDIASYSGRKIEFFFYFPEAGEFTQFPVQISKKNKVLGFGQVNKITVSIPKESKQVNIESWDDVSVNAKDEDVLKYLETHNIYETDLKRIYWRLSKDGDATNKEFFINLCKLLKERKYYDSNIWQHCIIYQTRNELSEYITYSNKLHTHLLPYFYSLWMEYDSNLNKKYCHLAYFPFYNARIHKLGTKRKILNNKLKNQYISFLNNALFKSINISSLSVKMLLELVYYLLIQNRIKESIQIFKLINKNEARNLYSFQYDYFNAYLLLFNDDKSQITSEIQNIISKYKQISLPKNKRDLFRELELQLNEINDFEFEQKHDNILNIEQKTDINVDYTLDFAIRDRKIRFTYNKIKTVEINFYTMDIELLFSMSPFLQRGNNNNDASGSNNNSSDNVAVFSYIEPNESIEIKLDEKEERDDLPKLYNLSIPKQLENKNIYIEIRSINPLDIVTPISSAFYDNNLHIQVKAQFGILRVLNEENMRPIAKAYCKVYAYVGYAKFHKDGYSDHRGQFDYVSVTCNHLKSTTKFAVLICTQKYGSVVKIINMPANVIDGVDKNKKRYKQKISYKGYGFSKGAEWEEYD